MGWYTRLFGFSETIDLTVTDDLTVTGLATIGETLAVTGATTLNDTLDVVGAASLPGNVMTTGAGAGITTGTGTLYASSVERVGDRIVTTIDLDLTGLNSATAGDIIGVNSAADCHLGRILAALNGTIFAGVMTCLEAPLTGDENIDLFKATASTGTEDAAISGLAGQGALLESSGDWTLGLVQHLTALPAANDYLYLVSGATTSATYTAGKFQIVLYGHPAA